MRPCASKDSRLARFGSMGSATTTTSGSTAVRYASVTRRLPSRNLLFDLDQRHHSTPVSPVRDIVKRFAIGSTPDGLPSTPAQCKIAPFVAYFCNTSPYPNQLIDGFRC